MLRKEYIARRRTMDVDLVSRLSSLIRQRCVELLSNKPLASMHIYTSCPELHEVTTVGFFEELKNIYPNARIEFGDASRAAAYPATAYDMIIVPLVVFDEYCNRIGFGGGWYDRFLKSQPQALKIGFAFESQRASEIPVESHDIQLDMIITESTVYYTNKNALPK